ncbi:hypothetical protein E2C01_014324 [Portunus trituberculatus]|uniref:Uncharacterized protein n=1 Tax=Portunus trituberculatus TaxID=210409 RepID=A0A5B7DIH4_PORTR|nr:hypothetical protein [Portunus trituberculatus]
MIWARVWPKLYTSAEAVTTWRCVAGRGGVAGHWRLVEAGCSGGTGGKEEQGGRARLEVRQGLWREGGDGGKVSMQAVIDRCGAGKRLRMME